MITGLNHTTLAVRDLEKSFLFYTRELGLRPVARWYKGAYLAAGNDWICLNLDSETRTAPYPEYTHLAFSVAQEEFAAMVTCLQEAGVICWQSNRSFGDSFYFLDPDGHKLEIHTSDLKARLGALQATPPKDLILFP